MEVESILEPEKDTYFGRFRLLFVDCPSLSLLAAESLDLDCMDEVDPNNSRGSRQHGKRYPSASFSSYHPAHPLHTHYPLRSSLPPYLHKERRKELPVSVNRKLKPAGEPYQERSGGKGFHARLSFPARNEMDGRWRIVVLLFVGSRQDSGVIIIFGGG